MSHSVFKSNTLENIILEKRTTAKSLRSCLCLSGLGRLDFTFCLFTVNYNYYFKQNCSFSFRNCIFILCMFKEVARNNIFVLMLQRARRPRVGDLGLRILAQNNPQNGNIKTYFPFGNPYGVINGKIIDSYDAIKPS